jgi:type IV secretion system protein VirD4
MRRSLIALAVALPVLCIWAVIASAIFLLGTGLFHHFRYPSWQWWMYLPYHDNPVVHRWLWISAVVPALAIAVACAGYLNSRRDSLAQIMRFSRAPGLGRLRPARPGEPVPEPVRARSDLHGSADWLSIKEAQVAFPGPHPSWGGVVVGEAHRPDIDAKADGLLPFDPEDRATWGRGGRAPLLVDPCTSTSTHGLVFVGSGGGKTAAVTLPSLDAVSGWRGSAVVLDPGLQAAPMAADMRRGMGQKVVVLGPGFQGFNALDWITPDDPFSEVHVHSVIESIGPELKEAAASGDNGIFRVRGRELQVCILADMIWDSSLPASEKTLDTFAARVATPEKLMRQRLQDIHAGSASPLARRLAGTLMETHPRTFSGFYTQANGDVQWLAVRGYADMLSGNDFKTSELADGNLTVFIAIPMDTLLTSPQVGRTVVNALLNGVYRAQGKVAKRVLFLLDEINLLGRMKALEVARDNGRKFGVTIVGMWQGVGQLEQTFGKDGKAAWYASASWRLYSGIDDDLTAEEVSKRCGTYTALARTEGNSTSSQSPWMKFGQRGRGENSGLSEQPHALITPAELRTKMRGDEAIILRRNTPPIRCGRAFYFRRPEMTGRLSPDPYRKDAA